MLPYCIKQLCLQLPGLLDMQVRSACRHLVYTDPSQTAEKMLLLFTLHDIHFCFHISESLFLLLMHSVQKIVRPQPQELYKEHRPN